MYYTLKVTKDQAITLCRQSMIRAGAVLEHGMRTGEDVATEYDKYAGERDGDCLIEQCRCGWTTTLGFWGTGYLHADCIPYALETVYSATRRHAIDSAEKEIAAAKKAVVDAISSQQLYIRSGSKFVKI